MKRVVLTDGSGRWFDREASESFEEDTFWDGNNHISRATGSQWEHEVLYRTNSGLWILHSWSQWQGSRPSWVEIDPGAAARWLSINEYSGHRTLDAEFAALEIV